PGIESSAAETLTASTIRPGADDLPELVESQPRGQTGRIRRQIAGDDVRRERDSGGVQFEVPPAGKVVGRVDLLRLAEERVAARLERWAGMADAAAPARPVPAVGDDTALTCGRGRSEILEVAADGEVEARIAHDAIAIPEDVHRRTRARVTAGQ